MSTFCTAGAMIVWALTIQPSPTDPVEALQCAKTEQECLSAKTAAGNIARGYEQTPELKCTKEGRKERRTKR